MGRALLMAACTLPADDQVVRLREVVRRAEQVELEQAEERRREAANEKYQPMGAAGNATAAPAARFSLQACVSRHHRPASRPPLPLYEHARRHRRPPPWRWRCP